MRNIEENKEAFSATSIGFVRYKWLSNALKRLKIDDPQLYLRGNRGRK